MENSYKGDLRLYHLINDDTTCNHIIELYKSLRGKENLEKRLFLKTLVYITLNPSNFYRLRNGELAFKPEKFLSEKTGFTRGFLEKVFKDYGICRFSKDYLGVNVKNCFGFMI